MNTADAFLLIVLLFGAVGGYRQGFLMEVISFIAILLGILGAFKLLGNAMLMIGTNFKISNSILPYVAFAVVFVLIVIVVSLLGKVIKSSIDKSFLGRVDQAMGGLVGMLKAAFLLSIIIWILDSMNIGFLERWFEKSALYAPIAGIAPTITSWISKMIPAFGDIL